MVDNSVLEVKLARDLKSLNLSEDQQRQVVKEINFLADLLIDLYQSKKQGGTLK